MDADWVKHQLIPYASKLAEFQKMKMGELAPKLKAQKQQQKTKEKGVNESEEERQYRIERRHRKFGKLAEALAKSVGHPGKNGLRTVHFRHNRRRSQGERKDA